MTYPGGKEGEGIWQRIVNLMPPHKVYVEMFAGGGAIARHKTPAERTLLFDLHRDALDALRLSYAKAHGLDLKADDLGVLFHNQDSIEWLRVAAKSIGPGVLIYADPPYPLSVRRSDRCSYAHELTDEQHVELLELLGSTSARVMISGYRCPIYDAWLSDWTRVDYMAMTRGGTMVPESLWMNFSPPAELHGYEHVGANYRERERIKRKRKRWLANFATLPDHERGAIFSDLENFMKNQRSNPHE